MRQLPDLQGHDNCGLPPLYESFPADNRCAQHSSEQEHGKSKQVISLRCCKASKGYRF